MPRRSPKTRRRALENVGSIRPVVVVCRGGDCGSRTKHPSLDHPAQLRQIRTSLSGTAEKADVVSSSCLDACEHSNVIVVIPGLEGRTAGGAPLWVGQVNDPETTRDLIDWVNAGGPGLAAEPTLVDIASFRPSRLNRQELDEATGLL